ncbi:MAG: extracellular solute-binding protein, partial [Acetobacteraceae bacterium]|nr:extracellular solute-binding protein [Acetobacteraceae bacterium]
AFEAKYPGIKVAVERSGGEQVFQRVMQEAQAGVHAADFVTSSNRSHFIAWKRAAMLAPYVTPDLLRWPAAQRDSDGCYASGSGTLTLLAWNTRLVQPGDAPRRFRDLLDPTWKDKIVLAHPAYSGSILSATYAIAQMLGWDFYRQLARQNIMQVQSGVEPPKKVAQGERQVMYGSEDTSWTLMEAGEPLAIAYPEEGTPGVAGAGGVLAKAPHPNAARLFAQFFFSKDGMQIVSDGGYRVFHPDVALKPGRKPLNEIKTVYIDQEELDRVTEDVKDKYAQIFGT